MKQILAIETSCDDTSVAVVGLRGYVHSVVSMNQDKAHAPFGGIVPEIAGRNHTEFLLPLIEQALEQAQQPWSEIHGVAVTNRPGLIGSLIVGLVTAKSISQARGIPLIGVNHLEGHLLAPFLRDQDYAPPEDFDFPYVGLAVSGGHTTLYHVPQWGRYEVLGATLDDAAGEAFDKFAKSLGLGWPGGAKVDQLAKLGDAKAFDFPRSMIHEDHLQMSFSGLKSSAQRKVESLSPQEIETNKSHLCASFQEAIVDVLIDRLSKAQKMLKIKKAVITGGVSANSRLRERGLQWAERAGVQLVIPPLRYCTDNAAMIGYAGLLRLQAGESHALNLGPSPASYPSDFVGENR
ncbi:MAG: tRNA (adenosine(37)-N6)-threonylcarbamoyltransferase complex transferase subunit TsaD [Proteobacteria bacterium]|jgi:N6-L-threonylcarbamoyladenine synthase|nr:tRNA (adenosine(37)-N6)-threonylcarbamoyltransferase complex transferase subunit TsaD [Pseudomonadota bacterium]